MDFDRFCNALAGLWDGLLDVMGVPEGAPIPDTVNFSEAQWWRCYRTIFEMALDNEAAQTLICQTLFGSVTEGTLTEANKETLTRVVNKSYNRFRLAWVLYKRKHPLARVNIRKPRHIVLEPLCPHCGEEEIWECHCDERCDTCGSCGCDGGCRDD